MKTEQKQQQIWNHTSLGGPANQGLIIEESTGRNVAVVYDAKDGSLVAAAPDLLGAAKAFMLDQSMPNAVALAAAISKAEASE